MHRNRAVGNWGISRLSCQRAEESPGLTIYLAEKFRNMILNFKGLNLFKVFTLNLILWSYKFWGSSRRDCFIMEEL